MARRGYTEQPCPGCGKPGSRPKEKVCWECEHLINEAKAAREAQAAETEHSVYRIPGRDYGLRSYYLPSTPSMNDTSRELLRDALWRVACLSGEHAAGIGTYQEPELFTRNAKDSSRSWCGPADAVRRLLSDELAQALDALDQAIHDAIQDTFATGVKHGSSLLMQLAEGQITMQQFEERTLPKPRS